MTPRPYTVGLTGGIGSGKSEAARCFAQQGAAVVDTDQISHALTAAGGAAMPALVQVFGPACVAEDGSLDRARMRALLLESPDKRQALEGILHPMIRAEATARINAANHVPYVVLVVPLLVEHWQDYRDWVDRVVVVDVDATTQLVRVASRPGLDEAAAKRFVQIQCAREARLALADDVLPNVGSLADLHQAIGLLHSRYLEAAGVRN